MNNYSLDLNKTTPTCHLCGSYTLSWIKSAELYIQILVNYQFNINLIMKSFHTSRLISSRCRGDIYIYIRTAVVFNDGSPINNRMVRQMCGVVLPFQLFTSNMVEIVGTQELYAMHVNLSLQYFLE